MFDDRILETGVNFSFSINAGKRILENFVKLRSVFFYLGFDFFLKLGHFLSRFGENGFEITLEFSS
jgi:hypothetical protein